IVDFEGRGSSALVSVLPPFLCRAVCNTAMYDPASRIKGLVPLRVARRYHMRTSWTNRIRVVAAPYGANCAATRGNATSRLAKVCDEKDSCFYKVDVSVLGDPARNCAKDFVVEWTCGESPVVRQARAAVGPEQHGEAGFGSIVTLTCGDGK